MTPAEMGLLLLSATFAGALNAIAGGGSFFTFPSLLWVGLGPIEANATSTVALWPGSVASAFGYRNVLKNHSGSWWRLAIVSGIGGVVGAWLLVRTPESVFFRVLPFLMLLATAAFTFGDHIKRSAAAKKPNAWMGTLLQFAIAAYGGYFGGGMGLMMLGLFSALGMKDIHAMNGLKSLLAVLINAAATVTFIVSGSVQWAPALLMIAGASLGGLGGSVMAQRIRPQWVRGTVIAVGWTLTAYFFWRASYLSASAPETISISSLVMTAWRVRL